MKLMTESFDGCAVPLYQYLPCGSRATFDHGSGHSYRCDDCWAVVGSIGQPQQCKDEADKYKALKILGSNVRWNYNNGYEEVGNG